MADHLHSPPPEAAGTGTEAMVRTFRLAFFWLRVLMGVLFVVYLFSGWFIVPQNEKNFLLRFGALVGKGDSATYESGTLNFAWPKPIDKRIRVEVTKIRTVSTANFWFQENTNVMAGPEANQPKEELQIGTDGYLLTGDDNMLHARWSLTYTVANPIAYWENYEDPDMVVKNVLENAIVKETGRTRIEEALYRDREALRQSVLQRVRRELRDLDLGIVPDAAEVSSNVQVYYEQQIPPGKTIESFQKVINADQEKSTKINEARAYASGVKQRAEGQANRIEAEAEAYRNTVVAATAADAAYLQDILPHFKAAPQTMLLSLYTDALRDALGKAEAIYTIPEGQRPWIRLGPQAKGPTQTAD